MLFRRTQTLPISWDALAHGGGRAFLQHVVPALPDAPSFWECAACSRDTRDAPIRFASTRSEALAGLRASPAAYAEHFGGDALAVAFANRRGDSRLVAPAPPGDFPHLQAFLATAPQAQQRALFDAVAAELMSWWDRTDAPVWLSTHGLGVPWLHVRLDPRPKYYHRRDLAKPPA